MVTIKTWVHFTTIDFQMTHDNISLSLTYHIQGRGSMCWCYPRDEKDVMPLNLYDLRDVLIDCNVIILITSKTYRVYMVTVLEIGIMVSNEHMDGIVSQWLKENLFGYRKTLIIRILPAIKNIAQMKHRANIFPFKYWEKSAFVESSLEGRKLKIIIFTSEMGIRNNTYFHSVIIVVELVFV